MFPTGYVKLWEVWDQRLSKHYPVEAGLYLTATKREYGGQVVVQEPCPEVV